MENLRNKNKCVRALPECNRSDVRARLAHDLVRTDLVRPISAIAVNLYLTILRDENYAGGYTVNFASFVVGRGPHYKLSSRARLTHEKRDDTYGVYRKAIKNQS